MVPREGRYVAADGAELDLDAVGAPASLQALVAARLDVLSPEEKRVVTDASVLGVSFTKGGLLALGSDPLTTLWTRACLLYTTPNGRPGRGIPERWSV